MPLLAFLALLPSLAFAWEGVVTKIHDGDSIAVRAIADGRQVKVRILGVDCPEYRQPYGKEAAEFVRALLPIGATVEVWDDRLDRYGKMLAEVTTPDGKNLIDELLKAGLAWVHKDCLGCDALYALELQAREAKRGLWKDKNPVPPWEWRKRQKR